MCSHGKFSPVCCTPFILCIKNGIIFITETLFHLRDESMAPDLRKFPLFCVQQDLQCVVPKFPSEACTAVRLSSVSGCHQPLWAQSGGDRSPELEKLESSTLWQVFLSQVVLVQLSQHAALELPFPVELPPKGREVQTAAQDKPVLDHPPCLRAHRGI